MGGDPEAEKELNSGRADPLKSAGADPLHDDPPPRCGEATLGDRLSAIVILIAVMVSLAVAALSGVSRLDALRSRSQIAASELENAFYSCLGTQLRRLTAPGTEAWANWDAPGSLRVVAAGNTEATPLRRGHLSLFLVPTREPGACEGYTIKAVSPSGVVRFGTALAAASRPPVGISVGGPG